MIVLFVAVLCLVSGSHSAPLACEDLVQPLAQFDPQHVSGRWSLVAGSLNDSRAAAALEGRDSVTVYFHNESLTHVNRVGDDCESHYRNFTVDEGRRLLIKVKTFNFTGVFLSSPCPDCAVLHLDLEAPGYRSIDLYLLSRRRELQPGEMEAFKTQVECLNLPPFVVMDPSKELCSETAESQ